MINIYTTDRHKTPRTTIALSKGTKARLDKNRAPGQCYDGFVCQMVDLWENASLRAAPNHRRSK